MDKFDRKVIGYESTKDILRQILNVLQRPEVYKKDISFQEGIAWWNLILVLGKSLLAKFYPDGGIWTKALCFS